MIPAGRQVLICLIVYLFICLISQVIGNTSVIHIQPACLPLNDLVFRPVDRFILPEHLTKY